MGRTSTLQTLDRTLWRFGLFLSVMILVIAIVGIGLMRRTVSAQTDQARERQVAGAISQPASSPLGTVTIYRLNAKASEAFIGLAQSRADEDARHNKEIERLNNLQLAILIGSEIPPPEYDRPWIKESSGIVAFMPKAQPGATPGVISGIWPSPSPSPVKKASNDQ